MRWRRTARILSLALAMKNPVATMADVAELKSNQANIQASITVLQGDTARLSEICATQVRAQ